MWPHFVQRSVRCSCPGREGVIRCTMVAPWQRSHREPGRTRGGEGAICADIFNLPGDCQNLVRGFKLATKPPSRIAAHGIADHQGTLDPITFGALESAEFVTRWAGRTASQHRTGQAARTAQALYGAKRRDRLVMYESRACEAPLWIRRVHDTLPDPAQTK
jgi:hypothetical protein